MSWSITRITHLKYPEITVRVSEFEAGGSLHVFRWVNGKQMSRSLKCRRRDLGSNQKAQEKEARRLACEYIEDRTHISRKEIDHLRTHFLVLSQRASAACEALTERMDAPMTVPLLESIMTDDERANMKENLRLSQSQGSLARKVKAH